MEKFSKFNDPLTGINPFLQPKYKRLSYLNYTIAFFYLPFFLLANIHPIFLSLIYKIKINKVTSPKVMLCNSVMPSLDVYILKYFFRIKNYYFVREDGYFNLTDRKLYSKVKKPCILFPEGTSTNNKSILKYSCNIKIDMVCFISYSSVYVYGSYLAYIFSVLSGNNSITIKSKYTNDVEDLNRISDVPRVNFTYKDKEKFEKIKNL